MTDKRAKPDPDRITKRDLAQVVVPLADLCRTPDGPRERQLIYGDAVTLFRENDGWGYVQSTKDGYCGYIRLSALGDVSSPTHKVSAPATHVYAKPDFKSPDVMSLSFASHLRVTDQIGKFAQTEVGFVPLTHLLQISDTATDPADIATLFLGTPYLWGGNSRWGLDCSGLVQAALLACGIPCPGDSDQQQAIGVPAAKPYQRNDLIFWEGHVALVVDTETLIHANAHTMSVTLEPIVATTRRIADQGDGTVTAHRRV